MSLKWVLQRAIVHNPTRISPDMFRAKGPSVFRDGLRLTHERLPMISMEDAQKAKRPRVVQNGTPYVCKISYMHSA